MRLPASLHTDLISGLASVSFFKEANLVANRHSNGSDLLFIQRMSESFNNHVYFI